MVCDISRAFFYAPVREDQDLYVELCDEYKDGEEDDHMCGKLRMSILRNEGGGAELAAIC